MRPADGPIVETRVGLPAPIKVDGYCPVCGERVDEVVPTDGKGSPTIVYPCGDTVHDTMRYTVRFHNVGDDLSGT